MKRGNRYGMSELPPVEPKSNKRNKRVTGGIGHHAIPWAEAAAEAAVQAIFGDQGPRGESGPGPEPVGQYAVPLYTVVADNAEQMQQLVKRQAYLRAEDDDKRRQSLIIEKKRQLAMLKQAVASVESELTLAQQELELARQASNIS